VLSTSEIRRRCFLSFCGARRDAGRDERPICDVLKWADGAPKEGEAQVTATGEALAVVKMIEHPDWTDEKIAKEIGVSRTTLYDWPQFKAARAVQKEPGIQHRRRRSVRRRGDAGLNQPDR
jgi:predicted DNA-binding protein (UPF0251 family)